MCEPSLPSAENWTPDAGFTGSLAALVTASGQVLWQSPGEQPICSVLQRAISFLEEQAQGAELGSSGGTAHSAREVYLSATLAQSVAEACSTPTTFQRSCNCIRRGARAVVMVQTQAVSGVLQAMVTCQKAPQPEPYIPVGSFKTPTA